ncbi:F0F1 ATP synthase subunit delta [Sporolactobacillus spathodeae]|uniref:ATP synthase subunit delta n=1 Tax=Sporolactobacillus spathodeae TaxID=1465502 RepID=A0ABS2QAX3_9BACL|nr:F0F1 ATP synthase subunit delta [Sporolactobacillus spathodeae]MBM7658968.1 F-type H+-transporting ATPase subunit delta [Sporolactobacillus spathodeae]
MSEIVANRYAEALFEVAEERQLIDAIETQLTSVTDTLSNNEELRRVLQHPQISADEKKALVDGLFKDAVGLEVSNLLKLLIDRKRESIINDVLEAYTLMANEKRGILDVTVTTAVPLDEEEQSDLARRLGEALGKKLRISVTVNKEIIGGILMRIGDRLYDGTIAGKLAGFKHEITSR